MICEDKLDELRRDIAAVLNRHSVDTDLATPDFVLAEVVINNLEAFGQGVKARREWFKDQMYAGAPLTVNSDPFKE